MLLEMLDADKDTMNDVTLREKWMERVELFSPFIELMLHTLEEFRAWGRTHTSALSAQAAATRTSKHEYMMMKLYNRSRNEYFKSSSPRYAFV